MAKLMLVEDDPNVRFAIAETLDDAGHSVKEAGSGTAALAALEKDADYDLVLVDYLMPEMKGDEVARRVNDRYPALKLAFLTGYGEFLEVTGRNRDLPLLSKATGISTLAADVEELLKAAAA